MRKNIPQSIRARQIELLYRHQPFAVLTSSLITLGLLYFLRDFPDQRSLYSWAGLMMLSLLFRAITTYIYSRSDKKSARQQRRSELLFLAGICFSGLTWGLLGIWLYPLTTDVNTHLLLLLIMVGLAGGASTSLSFQRPPVTCFVLLVLLPTLYSLYATEGNQNIAIGLAIVLYIIFLLKNAYLFQKNHQQLLLLKEMSLHKERKLRRSQRAAEEASRAKTNFLANMSHEIRTPMNVIIGMSRLIKETELDAQQKKFFARIESSATILMGLLNGILDFSKIEAGQLILEKQPFLLETLLDGIHSTMSGLAREKQLALHIDKDPLVPEAVIGDSVRLSQVLINLLGNAIKFTEQGEVRLGVRVDTEKDQDRSCTLRFTVEDTGIGIPENKQKLLFESFQQADTSISRKYGGTGLGLAICKQLVQLMGGTITVESRQGKGARFSFTVLLEPCSPDAVKQVHITDTPSTKDKMALKLLLVEDNEANRELAIIVLESAGQTVTAAVDGLDALHKLGEQHFDLILMDVQMPQMNGIATTRMIRAIEQEKPIPPTIDQDLLDRLKANLAGGHIPIIAMTAHAMDSDRQRCLDAGMDAYLTKPFQPEQVLDTLANFCPSTMRGRNEQANNSHPARQDNKGEERCRQSAEAGPGLPGSTPPRKQGPDNQTGLAGKNLTGMVREHLQATYNLQPEQIEQLLSTSADSLRKQLDRAGQALDTADCEELRKAAHAAKGNLLNLGLNTLSDMAASLEKQAAANNIADCVEILKKLRAGLNDLLN